MSQPAGRNACKTDHSEHKNQLLSSGRQEVTSSFKEVVTDEKRTELGKSLSQSMTNWMSSHNGDVSDTARRNNLQHATENISERFKDGPLSLDT